MFGFGYGYTNDTGSGEFQVKEIEVFKITDEITFSHKAIEMDKSRLTNLSCLRPTLAKAPTVRQSSPEGGLCDPRFSRFPRQFELGLRH
jgi:hypothetical protein